MKWVKKYVSLAGDDDDDDDGSDGDENEEEDDEQSGTQLPVDKDHNRNDRADNDRRDCDYLVEDNHAMMTGGMLSTMKWMTMMCARAILIVPRARGRRWLRARFSSHTKQMCVRCQIRGKMGSFIGWKMGRNNGLTFGNTLLP